MRKKIALSIILIALFLQTKSQSNAVEFGINGGMNINSASGASIIKEHNNSLTGFNIGGHLKIKTSDHFGIKAKLQYDQMGWAYRSLTFSNNTGTGLAEGDVLYKLSYLNIPVLAEYSFGNRIKFNAGAGFFFGILLNNQLITKIKDGTNSNPVTTKSNSKSMRSANFGISLGAGLQIPVSPKIKLDLNLHDNYGLSGIGKPLEGTPRNEIKTNSFSINSGFTFLL